MIDQFAWPWVLLGLLALPVIAWRGTARGSRPTVVYSAVTRAARAGAGWRVRLRFIPVALRCLVVALLVVALARPQSIDARRETTTEGIAIQLVVDRSRSMDEPGMIDGEQVTRLEAAKRVVAEFIRGDEGEANGREGDLIGLIVFGTFADTLCPLVREHKALLDILSRVEIPLRQSEGGTAIGDALALAAARLQSAEEEITRARADDGFELKSKAIVLLTDGENTAGQLTPMGAAQFAEEWGIRTYIIGIRGGASRIAGGRRVSLGQHVNERELTRVAELTGGRFWAVEELSALRDVYAEIDELEKTEITIDEHTEYNEEFPPFAIAGLCALVLEALLAATVFRRAP